MYHLPTNYKWAVVWMGDKEKIILSKHKIESAAQKELRRVLDFLPTVDDKSSKDSRERYMVLPIEPGHGMF